MKERIVVDEQNMVKSMKVALYEEDKLFCLQKVEKIPETFEELKELCRSIKRCQVYENHINVSHTSLTFYNNGEIIYYCRYYIKTDATPQQMWNIIKPLTGEE